MGRKSQATSGGPQDRLTTLAEGAIDIARRAQKHRKSLSGDNFYANKIAELRADAANCIRELSGQSLGDISALAENVELVFSPETPKPERLQRCRELSFSLRTTWNQASSQPGDPKDNVFPQSLLAHTKRAYLQTLGRQANGCYELGWYDACSVIMRRILETTIIEAFEAKGIAAKIKNTNGDFVFLSDLIIAAQNETIWNLSRNTKHALPQLKDLGDRSAHSRYFTAQKSDVEKIQPFFRVAVEEFLHLANLLT